MFFLAQNILQVVQHEECLLSGFAFSFPEVFLVQCISFIFCFQGPSLKQFMDIFSLPEMTLLSSVIDYFITHGIEFDQVHLYKDISVSKMSTASYHIRFLSSLACELCSIQT